jgi:hypothetical protein
MSKEMRKAIDACETLAAQENRLKGTPTDAARESLIKVRWNLMIARENLRRLEQLR